MKIGLEVLNGRDDSDLLKVVNDEGFYFGLSELLNVNSSLIINKELFPASLSIQDLKIQSNEHARRLMAQVTNWIDLENKEGGGDETIRTNSELLVKKQVEWASHLGCPTIIFVAPTSSEQSIANFSRVIASCIQQHPFITILIRIGVEGWKTWNQLRNIISPLNRVGIAIDFAGSDDGIGGYLEKWLAEPVKTIILPTSCFMKNKNGFPVLTKDFQKRMFRLFKMIDNVVISSAGLFEGRPQEEALSYHREYIQHLHDNIPSDGLIDRYATGYHDYLQAPLQPLMDDLQSATYEVFESDPVKYIQYEEAIYKAMLDRLDVTTPIVIMVVGAGRGPLVERSLNAAKRAGREYMIYAIEKNPNAIIGLRLRNLNEWDSKIVVVHTDMRFWSNEEKCDILVSELLGSFGDNELSPECLDGAQKLLKDSGISIPSKYSSYIEPISSSSLHSKAAESSLKGLETPYVVKFRDIYHIDKPKLIWTFSHPNSSPMHPLGHPDFNSHNSRYATAVFDVAETAFFHGLAAYFDCVLYQDINISILPESHSPDMTSWFPMYFPCKEPFTLLKNSQLEVHLWRICTNRKVWYEWSFVQVIGGEKLWSSSSGISNKDGSSYWIGL